MNRALVVAGIVWRELLRRKDLYVLFILLGALLLAVVSLDVFGLGRMTRYVKDTGLLAAWVFSILLALGLAARQLPAEEGRATIFAMLSKPVSRGELLAGKWLGAWTGTLAATFCFYVLLAVVVAARGGRFPPVVAAQAFLLHAGALSVLTALAIAISTRWTAGAALTLSGLLALAAAVIVPEVPRLVASADPWRADALRVIYYALPHFELFDLRARLVHEWPPVSWWLTAGIFLYGMAWTLLLMVLAWLGYRRKYFVRGER